MKTIRIMMAALILLVFAIPAFSQVKTGNQSTQTKTSSADFTPGRFVDKNNNGVCDNYEARGLNGRGARFVDNDNDGICDYRQNAAGNGCGYGKGYRHRNGQCCGRGFGRR